MRLKKLCIMFNFAEEFAFVGYVWEWGMLSTFVPWKERAYKRGSLFGVGGGGRG